MRRARTTPVYGRPVRPNGSWSADRHFSRIRAPGRLFTVGPQLVNFPKSGLSAGFFERDVQAVVGTRRVPSGGSKIVQNGTRRVPTTFPAETGSGIRPGCRRIVKESVRRGLPQGASCRPRCGTVSRPCHTTTIRYASSAWRFQEQFLGQQSHARHGRLFRQSPFVHNGNG
jgi:hypothetical protein